MSSTSAIDYHGEIAAQFDRRYESSVAFLERFRVWTDLLDQYVKPIDRVLDLGCGSGIFSNYLAEKGCIVTGIDGSEAMIALCNQKKKVVNVRYVVQSLPLPDPAKYAPQDVVMMSSLLEYMDNMDQMLQQVRDLLKPNGLLIVSIPNQLSLYRRVERRLFRLTGWPAYFAHIRHRSTAATFSRHLSELGFYRIETTFFSSHDPISRLLKPFLARQYVNNLFVGVYRKETLKNMLPTHP
ncbi:class I SAM-dependent methyltransferase [Spirosoma endophyticum]|uniref:2-polyprenyl-6-hydroxyphenyl methylase / 3-demethylubiquinone-9 3-methyltransferase n=1 Tax=Spirosoma endophyticum TaxID=662367 RepID=A0A1I2FZ73_9BACT|nr:class I SAM-dependent methyltransferase [Spirosoma endophyticum]SFF09816.1 2-polyprenyl-6-hydroxyphenyl methylase / 3-demethylubiquinone-9 3-methyltransferase [Spirosoma endophyticum]